MIKGQRVSHPIFGLGTVISVEDSPKLGDNNSWERIHQSSIIRVTNGRSRYTGNLNIGVKFDNGGPQGFASGASNDVKDLQIVACLIPDVLHHVGIR